MYYRDTIIAGKTIMRSLKAVARINTANKKRAPKAMMTNSTFLTSWQKINKIYICNIQKGWT